ncbi:MAG: ELM1/GtrOC1 family putative glycosyltransferase [Verrucomicrobiota bacterium]
MKDRKSGHLNKAQGLLLALGKITEIHVVEFPIAWRVPGLRQLLSYLGKKSFKCPIHWVLKNVPSMSGIDLIVSAGGLTQWPNAALAYQFHKSNVFLGSPRKMNPDLFTLIGMHDAPRNQPPYYHFDIIPSLVSPESAEQAANEAGLPLHRDWGILMGGDGEGIAWKEDDYLEMTEKFLTQAKDSGNQVRIATSRRTPVHVEVKLREMVTKSGLLAGACWYHSREQSAPSLLAMLGACSRLAVTADSMSMTHEAVSSGRPVFVIRPEVGGNPRLMGNIDELATAGYLLPQNIKSLDMIGSTPENGWRLIARDPSLALAEAVIASLPKSVFGSI